MNLFSGMCSADLQASTCVRYLMLSSAIHLHTLCNHSLHVDHVQKLAQLAVWQPTRCPTATYASLFVHYDIKWPVRPEDKL